MISLYGNLWNRESTTGVKIDFDVKVRKKIQNGKIRVSKKQINQEREEWRVAYLWVISNNSCRYLIGDLCK